MAGVAFPSGSRPEPHAVADWCEFKVLSERKDFKKGDLKTAIGIEDIDEPDLLSENVWNLLETRSMLHREHWALEFTGTRIKCRAESDLHLLHSYLSLISLGDLESDDRVLFEELVADIFRSRWGRSVMRVGHPASPRMNPSFRKRLKAYGRIAQISDMEMPTPPFTHDKDLGLDVVAWLPTPDRRGGFPHLYIQCATGNDWKSKLNDIDHGKLRYHLDVSGGFLKAFCVPFTLSTTTEQWTRYSASAGWIIDRPRLLYLASDIEFSTARREQLTARIQFLSE